MELKNFSTLNFSTLIGAGVIATALGAIAQPADAFTITRSEAVWDNLTLQNGSLVGSKGVAANADNKVSLLNIDGESQIRWGSAFYGGYYQDNFEEVSKDVQVTKYKWDWVPKYSRRGWFKGYEYKKVSYQVTETVTETVNNKVWVPPTYENQSGLGYKGVSNLDLDLGEVFNIGTLKHFNQTIKNDGLAGTNTDFSLKLDFGDGIGSKLFDFSLSIDETPNRICNNNNGKDCAYQTDAGKGCADQITWDFAINNGSTFEYENETYSLELVGFGSGFDGTTIVNEFISQEDGNNSASLFAKLVKVDTTQDIPEPASLLGLAGLGLYFARSRKKHEDALTV